MILAWLAFGVLCGLVKNRVRVEVNSHLKKRDRHKSDLTPSVLNAGWFLGFLFPSVSLYSEHKLYYPDPTIRTWYVLLYTLLWGPALIAFFDFAFLHNPN